MARDRVTRPGDVYSVVHRLIVRGRLVPGARVAEGELATRLAVSRTPVREAMRRLLSEGLLVSDGGGARPRTAVAPVGARDVEELYQAAGALEGVIARHVSELSPHERRALFNGLKARENDFRRATRTRSLDYDLLFERHDAFHALLREGCGGPVIQTLLATLQPRLDRYEWLYAPLIGPDFSPTFAEHAAIIRAVRSGGSAACERAVRANWFSGGARLGRALSNVSDGGMPFILRRS
ncbi:MAG: GntR family transcriptional regulator, partial [Gemmatimonadaceae bacterium]